MTNKLREVIEASKQQLRDFSYRQESLGGLHAFAPTVGDAVLDCMGVKLLDALIEEMEEEVEFLMNRSEKARKKKDEDGYFSAMYNANSLIRFMDKKLKKAREELSTNN